MYKEETIRTEMLLGSVAIEKLNKSKVAIFGLGGVGGYCAEALSRSGINAFELFDNDKYSVSNLNRQILATYETVGKYKTEVTKEHILSINSEAKVNIYNMFVLPENVEEIDCTDVDYIVDAIDTVSGKLALIELANKLSIPIISCMGTGNKVNAELLTVTDIYKTQMCPLAKVMRKELKDRGIQSLKVVYSPEEVKKPYFEVEDGVRRSVPSSWAVVPAVAGLLIAGEVIRDLCGI